MSSHETRRGLLCQPAVPAINNILLPAASPLTRSAHSTWGLLEISPSYSVTVRHYSALLTGLSNGLLTKLPSWSCQQDDNRRAQHFISGGLRGYKLLLLWSSKQSGQHSQHSQATFYIQLTRSPPAICQCCHNPSNRLAETFSASTCWDYSSCNLL